MDNTQAEQIDTSNDNSTKDLNNDHKVQDWLVAFITLALYCLDIGTDIATGVSYLQEKAFDNATEELTLLEDIGFNNATSEDSDIPYIWWGPVTLVFVGLSLFVTNIIAIIIYSDEDEYMHVEHLRWRVVRTVFFICQLGMLFLIFHKLYLKKKRYEEDRYEGDAANFLMLRILQAFIEAAPQLILQLYIMTKLTEVPWLTALSAASSFSSIVWLARSVYKDNVELKPLPWLMEGCLILWAMLTIAPRMVALALFESAHTWMIFPVMFAHWIVSIIHFFLTAKNTNWYYMYVVLLAFPNVFIFFPFDWKYNLNNLGFYYILQFIENSILFSFWFFQDGEVNDVVYAIPAAVIVWGLFPIGITVLIIFCQHAGFADK